MMASRIGAKAVYACEVNSRKPVRPIADVVALQVYSHMQTIAKDCIEFNKISNVHLLNKRSTELIIGKEGIFYSETPLGAGGTKRNVIQAICPGELTSL